MFDKFINKIFKSKIVFRIEDKNNWNIYIELTRCGLNKCDGIKEWIKGKYIADCGEASTCYMDKDEAICKLALMIQKDKVRYYKELEDRGFRK